MKLHLLADRLQIWSIAIAVGAVISLSGCSHGPAKAQIEGKVLLKDGSVPQGEIRTVRFEPTKDSPAEIRKGASGNIGDDGSFTMYTQRPGDGVYFGDYTVTFAVWKGPMEPVSLIDETYANAATSPYKITVDGDRNDLTFEIEPK